jgi:hypothetical protein
MKRTMVVMCVLFVLAWVAADALGQGKGRDRPGRPTDRVANPNKAAETAKPDATAPAADAKGTPNVDKGGKGKTKDALDEVKGKGKAAKDALPGTKGPADKGKGKQHEQQMLAFQKQQQKEAAKHLERQARLNRIRELAVQKGDKEMIARVDKLIAKESEVNSRKLQQLQQQHRALMGEGTMPGTTVTPPAGNKGKEKAEANKAEEKPAETKPPETKPPEPAPAETKPPEAKPQNPPAQEKPAEQPKPQ